mgnify:CR=1 FL=1
MACAGVRRWLGGLVALVFLWAAAAGVSSAEDVYVDVTINGVHLEKGALVLGDRSYVALEDVARVLGGRFLYDADLNTAFVLTGRYVSLVADELMALNPAIGGYGPIGPFVTGRGIPFGLAQPHITVSFAPGGLATAFVRIFVIDAIEHKPWFDQEPGRYERFAAGDGYSQHLFVVDPGLIETGGPARVAFNGSALNLSSDALHWVGDVLYVRLRDLAEASGGGVGWDAQARRASAKIVPGADLTWKTLVAFNERTVGHYALEPGAPGEGGERHTVQGPGLTVGVDAGGRVSYVRSDFPAAVIPWFPWFDQTNGGYERSGSGEGGYSQHIYLVAEEERGR